MEWFEGGITSPKGFRANSVAAGLKREGLDLTIIECEAEASCGALFTTNAVKAAPVIVSQEHLGRTGGRCRAVVINSGNANACNGPSGLEDSRSVAAKAAELLGTAPEKVLLASTGVIGRPLDVSKILRGLDRILGDLSDSPDAGRMSARAIMTTDTRPKEAALRLDIDGHTVTVAGMAKGAGMIHPNLATMIAVVTTDASIRPAFLQRAVWEAARTSFNMISIDGDMSTNDTLLAMASGAAGGPEIEGGDSYEAFSQGLNAVCTELGKMMVRDGEGATRIFEVQVRGADTEEDARECARSIAKSNLVKSAIFGQDPNWGRIVAAAGYSGARVDPDLMELWLEADDHQPLHWVSAGCGISEETNELARKFLGLESFRIVLDLGIGESSAVSWGCDLTYEYVKVNSEYTT